MWRSLKSLPVYRYSVVMFTFSGPSDLLGSPFIWEQSCAQPGARRHLPLSLIIRLNQTKSAVFKLWMLYFQRIDLFSDYVSLESLGE